MKCSDIIETEKCQETYNEIETFSGLSYLSVFAKARPMSCKSKFCLITMFSCIVAFAKQDEFLI